MKFTHFGTEQNGSLEFDRYASNNNLAVQLICDDGIPYATISTNVEGVQLASDEFIAKTYSENKGLVEQFIESGCFEDTGRVATVGYADSQPILRAVTLPVGVA